MPSPSRLTRAELHELSATERRAVLREQERDILEVARLWVLAPSDILVAKLLVAASRAYGRD